MAEDINYKSKKASWESKYEKEGLGVFSPDNIGILRAIQAKYSIEYVEFFTRLAASMKDTSMEESLVDAVAAAKGVAAHIGLLLGSRGRPATPQEIDKLFDMMAKVSSLVEYYKKQMAKNSKLSQSIQSIQAETGTSIKDLSEVAKMTESKIAGMKKPTEGAGSYFKRVAPEMYETGRSLLGGAMQGILGPFAGIAGMAVGGITGVAKDIRERHVAKQEAKFIRNLSPYSMGVPTGALSSMYGGEGSSRGGRGTLGGVMGPGSLGRVPAPMPMAYEYAGVAPAQGAPPPQVGGRIAAESQGTTLGNALGVASIVEGMFIFFDKRAERAKWTRDIHDFMKKTSKESGGGGGGILGSLAAWFGGKKLLALFSGMFGGLIPGLGKAFMGLGHMLFLPFRPLFSVIGKLLGLMGPLGRFSAILGSFHFGMKGGFKLREMFPQIDEFLSGKNGLFTKMMEGWDKFSNWFSELNLGEKVMEWFASIPDQVALLGENLGKWWGTFVEALKPENILNTIKGAVEVIKDAFVGAVDFFVKLITDLPNMLKKGWEKTKEVGSAVVEKTMGFFGNIGAAVGKWASKEYGLGMESFPELERRRAQKAKGTIAGPEEEQVARGGRAGERIPATANEKAMALWMNKFSTENTKALNKLAKDIQKSRAPETATVGRASDIDAFNTRDTSLEFMNTGGLGVDE